MADEFAEHLLASSLALMCKQQGWHQASRSGLGLYSDIARHYIRNIGILTLRYSLHGGRFEPDLDDLGNAFTELGLVLSDLQSYWAETEGNLRLAQVCKFPVQVPSTVNIPTQDAPTHPDYIPDYLPSLVVKEEPKIEDKTVKEDSTIVVETSSERAPDPFDEAAAAPAPTAPNFPFVNKTEHPAPKMSSWGFQRITIDETAKPSENLDVVSLPEKPSKASPDNFVISENSDDFVFASKHSKAREEKKASPAATTPPVVTVTEPNNVEPVVTSESSSQESELNVSMFLPSLGTSTPLVTNPKPPINSSNGGDTVNGLTCRHKLFTEKDKPTTVIEEELSGFVPEVPKPAEVSVEIRPTTPEISLPCTESDTDDFADFGFSGSSSDELMTSKENMEHLLKPLSPPIVTEKPKSPVVVNNKSPPNKRRKLDKPASPPQLKEEKQLLKNRPDLMKNDTAAKPKVECKLVNNHHNAITKVPKNSNHSNKKNDQEKVKHQQKSVDLPLKPKKVKPLSNENNLENNHRTKKVKKKDASSNHIDLFEDSTIMLSNSKVDKPKKDLEIPETIPNHVTAPVRAKTPPLHTSVESTPKLKIAPLTLSLPKKDTKTDTKKTKTSKITTKVVTPATNSDNKSSSLKISLKNPHNSKYKSKSVIDSEDDLSSLSSDSLDGFEDLLPKKSVKLTKDEDTVNKRMFKTKAELKNPWPSSSSLSTPSAVSDVTPKPASKEAGEKKKPKAGITTKIKIGKSLLSSPKSGKSSPKTSPKNSMKLKLPIPPSMESSSSQQDTNSSVYSQPSLRIDESFVDVKPEVKPVPPKIPRIKIKIGGAHLNNLDSPSTSSPSPSYSSSTFTSPEPPPLQPPPKISIKPLKIKIPDPSTFLPSPDPLTDKKSDHGTVKKPKVKTKKVKDPKPTKPKPPPIKVKEDPIIPLEEPVPILDNEDVPDPLVSETLESTLVSETVVSETVCLAPGAEQPVKIWYCPTCRFADDGSPMVGCDACDDWYHWVCVGIVREPDENVDWYCPACTKKRKSVKRGKTRGTKRKRKT